MRYRGGKRTELRNLLVPGASATTAAVIFAMCQRPLSHDPDLADLESLRERTTIACGLTAVLLAGLAGAPSASATSTSTAESASAEVRAEQRRMLEQSSSNFDARLAEPQRIQECQSVAEGTDELDDTELDAEFYGLGFGCAGSTSGWLFALQTRDLWADSALDGFSFNVELDGNPDNGCQGADRNALGFYSTTSSQLVSGVYTTASCDSATWTLDLASQIARSTTDDVALAFDNAALGNPRSFQWTSSLTGVNESGFDFVPSTGTLQAVVAGPSVSPTPRQRRRRERPPAEQH